MATATAAAAPQAPLELRIVCGHRDAPTTATIELCYQLHAHSVARRFAGLITRIHGMSPRVDYVNWCVFPDAAAIPDVVASMNASIDYFAANNGYGYTIPACPPRPTTEELNAIHANFEKYMALLVPHERFATGAHNTAVAPLPCRAPDLPAFIWHLENVNNSVHCLEQLLRQAADDGGAAAAAWFTCSLMSNQTATPMLDLEPAEFPLFQMGARFGGLMLGYAVTGKTLHHIVRDNDVGLLAAGGKPSVQKVLGSSVMASFFEVDPAWAAGVMRSWAAKHDIKAKYGIDPDDEATCRSGYVPLGELVAIRGLDAGLHRSPGSLWTPPPPSITSLSEADRKALITALSPYSQVQDLRIIGM